MMNRKHFLGLAALAATMLLLNGCVATGVGVGYDTAYYEPSYGGYYGDYGYDGSPYWGASPYVGSTVVIGGRSHRAYWGGHHFAADRRGVGAGGGFHRGGTFRGTAGGGMRGGQVGAGARGGGTRR